MLFGLFGKDKDAHGAHGAPDAHAPHGHDDHGHAGHGAHDHPVHDDHGHAHAQHAPEDIGQVALDVVETDEAVVLVAPLAGVPKDAVDINLSRNILTISGERARPSAAQGRPMVSECFFGPFSRSVILPEHLALNKVRATMEDNLLLVTVPKLVMGAKSVKIERFASSPISAD